MSKSPKGSKPSYTLYEYMLRRCYMSTTPNFHRYGGRGIKVCKRWRKGAPGVGYRNFCADVGPRPPGYSLDRRDNDGDYTPQNCRWVPRSEQYRNRCTNVWITFMGVRMIAKDWARETGVRADVITKRIANGWPLEVALFHTERLRVDDPTPRVEAAAAKKRAQTHCKRGHPLSGDNVYILKAKGWTMRSCRTCKRESMRERRAHLRAPPVKQDHE